MNYHPLKIFIIDQKSQKTSEVTSILMPKNFKTMNFWSDSKSLGGFCGVQMHHSLLFICFKSPFLFPPQVVDVNTGAILPANERGELYFRGPQLMQGYVDKTATKEVLDKDGWYKTGTSLYN